MIAGEDRAKVASARGVFRAIGVELSDNDALRIGNRLNEIGLACQIRDAATQGRSEIAKEISSVSVTASRLASLLSGDEMRCRLASAFTDDGGMDDLIPMLQRVASWARTEVANLTEGPSIRWGTGDQFVIDLAELFEAETGVGVGFPQVAGVYTGPFIRFVGAAEADLQREPPLTPTAIRSAYRRSVRGSKLQK